MSNRAAGMPTVGSIEIHDVPTPNPRPLKAFVRIDAVGVCGTVSYRVRRLGDRAVDGPLILGHGPGGILAAAEEDR